MIKILLSTLFLVALATARITIPISQHQIPSPVLHQENLAQAFLSADNELGSLPSRALNLTVNNSMNMFYYGKLYVGENSTFRVMFQTGSQYTWLPGVGCVGCPSAAAYDCNKSSTCDQISEVYSIQWTLGAVSGYPGHEMIGLTQDFKVNSSVLFATLGASMEYYRHIDGFIGMSSNLSDTGYIDLAYQQNYIQEKVFSFNWDYNNDSITDSNSSYISIGYIPEEKVNKLTWVSLNASSLASWSVPMTTAKIGNKEVSISSGVYSKEIIIDSGSPFLLLAREIIQELKSQLQGIESTTFLGGSYYICNSNFIEKYPNITLKLANMDLVLNVYTYLEFGSPYVIGNKYYCQLAAEESTSYGTQVLGNSFLRNNFVAFSKRNQTVGISQEYRPIDFGSIATPTKNLPVLVGAGALVLVIILVFLCKKNQKDADSLKQALNSEHNDVYNSRSGI